MNRLLTRDFILNWGASFIGYLSFYLIQQPVMPLYVQSIGGGPQQIGVVIGATSLATLLARPLAGRATDSVGRRALIMAGMGGCGLCAVAYGVAGALALLLAVVSVLRRGVRRISEWSP
jgi:MFS family permease